MSLSALLRYPYRMRHTGHNFSGIDRIAGRANPLLAHSQGLRFLSGKFLVVFFAIACALLGGLLTACGAHDDSVVLKVEQGYVKTPVPGKDLTAAYAQITNRSARQICLAEFVADFAQTVEVHATEQRSDRVRMQRLDQLCIAPSETIRLAPGGKHFMLFGVAGVAAPGEQMDIVLIDTNQQRYPASFDVRAFNAPPP